MLLTFRDWGPPSWVLLSPFVDSQARRGTPSEGPQPLSAPPPRCWWDLEHLESLEIPLFSIIIVMYISIHDCRENVKIRPIFFFQTKHLFIPSWACMYLIYFVLCCIYFIYLSIYHSKGEHEAVVRRLHTVILGMSVPKKVSRAVLVCSNRATKFGKLWQTAVKC